MSWAVSRGTGRVMCSAMAGWYRPLAPENLCLYKQRAQIDEATLKRCAGMRWLGSKRPGSLGPRPELHGMRHGPQVWPNLLVKP